MNVITVEDIQGLTQQIRAKNYEKEKEEMQKKKKAKNNNNKNKKKNSGLQNTFRTVNTGLGNGVSIFSPWKGMLVLGQDRGDKKLNFFDSELSTKLYSWDLAIECPQISRYSDALHALCILPNGCLAVAADSAPVLMLQYVAIKEEGEGLKEKGTRKGK